MVMNSMKITPNRLFLLILFLLVYGCSDRGELAENYIKENFRAHRYDYEKISNEIVSCGVSRYFNGNYSEESLAEPDCKNKSVSVDEIRAGISSMGVLFAEYDKVHGVVRFTLKSPSRGLPGYRGGIYYFSNAEYSVGDASVNGFSPIFGHPSHWFYKVF